MLIPKSRMPLIIEMVNCYLYGRSSVLSADDIEHLKQIRNQAASCEKGNATHLSIELRKNDDWKQFKSNSVPAPGMGTDF